jgi:hypothetical protein
MQIVRVNGQPDQKKPNVQANHIRPRVRRRIENKSRQRRLRSTGQHERGPTTSVSAATVIDLNAIQPAKFHHIKIAYP